MELFIPKIKNFLIFSQKNFPYIWEMERSSPKIKKFQELSELKRKKPALKRFLIFWEMELSSPKLKKLL